MDRLVAETETKTEVEVETKTEEKVEVKEENISLQEETIHEESTQEAPPAEYRSEYLKSFEDMTLADMINKEDVDKQKELQKEKEELIEQQFTQEEKVEEEKIIEKPNFDLIKPDKRVIKLRRKQEKFQPKERKKSKKFGLILAIGLGIASVLCVTNVAILQNYSSSLSQLETEFYEVNLPKYLKDVANLDTTKKSMEFLDTYPEEINNAGELGTKTNWFDKFCNFLGGLFGG